MNERNEDENTRSRDQAEIKKESIGRGEEEKNRSHNETQQESKGKSKEEQNHSDNKTEQAIGEHQVEHKEDMGEIQGQNQEEIKQESEEEKNQSHNETEQESEVEKNKSHNETEQESEGRVEEEKNQGHNEIHQGDNDTYHSSDFERSTYENYQDASFDYSDSEEDATAGDMSTSESIQGYGDAKPQKKGSRWKKMKGFLSKPFKSSKTKHDIPNVDTPLSSKQWCKLQIFQRPMCLISTNEEGNVSVEENALNQIKKIDCPLVVVAIAGLYRTGKSYLMNRLAGSNAGFQLGNTIQSETKGIWAWCRPHPKKEDHVLLLLDTEGLGDVAKGDSLHDNKIFTLAALLCNVLVYNMMSAFNQDAVEKLTFITEMSKNINFKSRSEMDQYSGDKLALILPTFVLCVRDFSLALVKDGVKISADQYLEDCLDLKPGKDNDAEKYNRPRKCIRKYFPTRRCFTFDRPGDREIMQKLETVHVKDLSKSFVEDTECFIHFVYGCKGKVLLSSKPVRGIMLASLMESYVHAIQNGAVPDVDDAISVVSKLENRRASDKAIQSFSQQLKRIKLPVIKKDDFRKLFQSIQESSLLTFRQDAMFDTEPFEKEAAMKMEELWRKTSTENMRLIQKHCYDQLLDVYNNSVGKRMRSGEYNVAGGYSIYRIELYDMKINYNNRTKNVEYYQTQHVLQKFLEDEVINERKIMMADQKLTEADRKRELDKIQKENQQAQTEQKKLFQTMLKEEKDRSDKHLAKMEKDRQMYLKQEQEKMKILMDKWKDQKELSEKQIQMMTTENEKQREEFKLEIKRLNDEILVRERECEERFEKLLEKEQMKNRMQHVEMKETFDSLLEMEKEDKKKMAQEMQIFRSELQKTKQEKDEERQKHEKEKRSLEQEKEKAKRQAECESKEKKKAMEEKELLTSANEQLELEKKQTTKENERLENEKAQLAKAKIKEEERRKASENKVERMKNRGLLDRILDVDV